MTKRMSSFSSPEDYLFHKVGDSSLTDAMLLARVAEGQGKRREAAFALLISRHTPMLRKVCRGLVDNPHDAEDLTQTTFLMLLRKADTIRDADSLASWLHGVARRLATPIRTNRSRLSLAGSVDFTASQDFSASELAETSEVVPIIRDEIYRLPDHYRDPVVLCCLEGRSNEEAATTLRVPVGTVKGRLSRARGMLKERLERRGLAVGTLLAALFGTKSAFASISNDFSMVTYSASNPATSSEAATSSNGFLQSTVGRWLRYAAIVVIIAVGSTLFGTAAATAAGAIEWPFHLGPAPQKIC